jgi:hypothetical protein
MALLLVFAAAMAINIRRGRTQIDCGCGLSALRQGLGWPLVARNLALAAVLGLRLADGAMLATTEMLVAAMSGVVLFLLYLFFNALNALPGRPASGARG